MARSMAVLSYCISLILVLTGCGGGYVRGGGGSSSGGSTGGNGGSSSGGGSLPSGGMSISSISPSSATAGSGDVTLTVTGTSLDLVHSGGHQTHTFAIWAANGSQTNLTIAVLIGSQLTAVVPAALLATPGTAKIFIQKWYFADDMPFATSNSLTFTVTSTASTSTAAAESMVVARSSHSSTLLANGMVLVAGGANASGTLKSAELYDPAKGTFAATGDLAFPRQGHSATLLSNGKVLIAGGQDDVGPIATAELYDPGSGTFTSVGNMTSVRWSHTATLLANGKVLLAGGANNSDSQGSAEVFDPVSNMFSPVSNMTTPRMHHAAIALADGKVLLAGGWSSEAPITTLASAELFDPDTNSFITVGNMKSPHWFPRSVLLPDGRVLIVGGNMDQFSTPLIEVFDPVSQSFTITANLNQARYSHTATVLPKGSVLVSGGSYRFSGPDAPESIVLVSSELYSPSSSRTTPAQTLTSPRTAHTATLLKDGRVLVIGGSDSKGNALATAEILQDNQ